MSKFTMPWIWRMVCTTTLQHLSPPPTPVELRLLRAVKSNAAKHLLATFPMMLNVSLEEDLGMFSTLSLCVLLQAL